MAGRATRKRGHYRSKVTPPTLRASAGRITPNWLRLDPAAILDDPRLKRAGVHALALHVAGMAYCARHLTDGLVPHSVVREILGPNGDLVARRLVDEGLWADAARGWSVVEYLETQPSREQVLTYRAQRSAAGAKANANRRMRAAAAAAAQPAGGEPPQRRFWPRRRG